MPDMFAGLCALSMLVAVVTVIGHGIWVLIAWIFRFLKGDDSSRQFGSRCAACGSPHGVVSGRCVRCGTQSPTLVPDHRQSEVEAFRRRINQWFARGDLARENYQTLLKLLNTDAQTAAPVKQLEQMLAATNASPPSSASPSPTVAPFFASPSDTTSTTSQLPTPDLFPPVSSQISIHPLDEPVYVADIVDSSSGSSVSRVAPTPLPTQPIAPRRTIADMLQAFMEDSNIRWAEIISGVLIVVSAVGLVISLRATLKERIPYFPALSFLLMTAAIHAAGLYSLKRWNLRRTSRGVLIIATLLVPLSFLASIILAGTGEQQRAVTDPVFVLAVVIGFASFATMNFFASRSLVRHGWWRLMTAVLGTSAGQLLINRLQPTISTPLQASALLAVPVGAYFIATFALLRQTARRPQLGTIPARQFFLELGLCAFALAAPIALFIAKSHAYGRALGDLSPLLSLVAATILASGLLAHRLISGDKLAAYRTAGTALAVLGGGCMLLMVAFAWPQLGLLVAVGAVNFALLTVMAFIARLPLLHVPAVGCLALGYLAAFHLWQGLPTDGSAPGARIFAATFAGQSGVALSVLTTCVAIAGGMLQCRRQLREDGAYYFLSALGLSGLCIAIAGYSGFVAGRQAQGDLASPLLLYFSFAAFAAAWICGQRDLRQFHWPWSADEPNAVAPRTSVSSHLDDDVSLPAYAVMLGSGLFLAAVIHALHLNGWLRAQLSSLGVLPQRPVLVAALFHSVLLGLISRFLALGSRRTVKDDSTNSNVQSPSHIFEFCIMLGWSTIASSIAALPLALFVRHDYFGDHAAYVAACSIPWFCFAFLRFPKISFDVFQSLATVSVVFAVVEICSRTAWWTRDLLSHTHLHVQGAVLAAWCGGWSALRRQFRQSPSVAALWRDEFNVDKIILLALTVCIPVLGLFACLPGIAGELGFVNSESTASNQSLSRESIVAAWSAVGLLLLALVVSLWEHRSLTVLALFVVASASMPLLLSDPFVRDIAVASALRWTFCLFLVVWTIPAYYLFGRPASERWCVQTRLLRSATDALRFSSLSIGASVILWLTLAAFVSVAAGNHPAGPLASSIFARAGSAVSYATPLFVLVVVLFGYALRESKSSYAMAASLTFQFALSLACLLPPLSAGAPIDQLVIAKLVQWNAVGLAAFGLVWAVSRRWIEPASSDRSRSAFGWDFLQTQMALLVIVQVGIAVWITVMLSIQPTGRWPVCGVLGSTTSYVGLILSFASFAWIFRQSKWNWSAHICLLLVLVAVHVFAATAHAWDSSGRWWGPRTLSVGRSLFAIGAAAWAIALTVRAKRVSTVQQGISPSTESAVTPSTPVADVRVPSGLLTDSRYSIQAAVIWSTVATVLAVLAAIRTASIDPLRPWWPVAVTITAMFVAGALAVRGRRQAFAYYSTALAGVAALLLGIGLPAFHPLRDALGFISMHVIALSLAATAWLGIEIYYQRRDDHGLARRRSVTPVHRFVGFAFLVGLLIYCGFMSLQIVLTPQPTQLSHAEFLCIIAALASVTLLMVGSMWDRRLQHAIFGIYLVTLGIASFATEQVAVGQPQRLVTLMAIYATHVALTGWMWSWGAKLAGVGLRLGIPEPIEGLRRTVSWLPTAVLFLSAVLVIASFVVVLGDDDRALRVTAACLPFLLAAGIAGIAQQHRRDAMQLIALLAAGLGCILLGWADTPADWSDRTVLLRAIRLLMALCALAFVFGVVAVRFFSPANGWRESARRVAVIYGGSAIIALLGILGLEVASFQPGIGAPVDATQIAAVSAVLVVLIIALISLAVLPGRDPMGLSERGRTAYVYAAQAVAGLLFAHIYLAIPELFSGRIRLYWPYIVVAIAFAGVGVSELFQRLQLRVLAEPFQRSGAFLALVPAIGMWIVNSRSEYSLVLFVIGVLYLLLSFSQKSLLAGVIAAIAGNGALWSLLDGTEDLTFSKHPQFWLIPPALSVLVAAQLNRRRLTEAQLVAIRYVAVSVIYLSSAGEMLKIGIGESLWPPVILILLAIAGVVFGIAMQIRAYLYLGAIFILVAMVSMVAHASRSIQQVWPWWAFGIVLGISIFILIGWFEGRRTQIMLLLNRLRQWEK